MWNYIKSAPPLNIAICTTAVINFTVGLCFAKFLNFLRIGKIRDHEEQILRSAREEGQQLRERIQSDVIRIEQDRNREWDRQKSSEIRQLKREEERLKGMAQYLEVQRLDSERQNIALRERDDALNTRRLALKEERKSIETSRLELIEKLETAAGRSRQDASSELREMMQLQLQGEIDQLAFKLYAEVEAASELRAKKIISASIDRLAVYHSSPLSSYTLHLPNDEIKGRIIGRDGRNIKYLEHVCGVTFTLDEQNTITVSTFDHMRRHIAKLVLEKIIQDGRIRQGLIDEAYETARAEVARQVQEEGQGAVGRADAGYFHHHLVEMLGKMKFRTSIGQNLLEHSLEVSAIMGLMAGELHLNVQAARRIGLLHDIGKVISHEVEGTHALVGADIAAKFGESKLIVNGIACHHSECPAESIEASLCKPADAISAARLGARQGKVEDYVKRLQQLEAMALGFTGIDKAYALQAGREIRVFVKPEEINDQGALNLSRQLAQKVHAQLQFPGKIQITIIRESRFVDFAF